MSDPNACVTDRTFNILNFVRNGQYTGAPTVIPPGTVFWYRYYMTIGTITTLTNAVTSYQSLTGDGTLSYAMTDAHGLAVNGTYPFRGTNYTVPVNNTWFALDRPVSIPGYSAKPLFLEVSSKGGSAVVSGWNRYFDKIDRSKTLQIVFLGYGLRLNTSSPTTPPPGLTNPVKLSTLLGSSYPDTSLSTADLNSDVWVSSATF